jgi:GNAT superfamily N-acetyltransferase
MSVTVQPVKTPQDHRTFADFIWEHYANDPHWVAPLVSQRHDVLDKRKNPAWDYMEGEYFLALRDGRVVGTIAAFINHRHNDYHKERVGWFGMFECIDDQATADALLNTAKAWVKAQGYDIIRGPQSFTTHEECGLLVKNSPTYPQPMVVMPYNPPYYQRLIEANGFEKVIDVVSCYQDRDILNAHNGFERYGRVAKRVIEKSGVVIRPLDVSKKAQEFKVFRDIYNLAWADNWGFVPMTDRELDALVNSLGMFVDPQLAYFAEIDGKAVGFALAIPNLNEALALAKPHPRTPEWFTLLKVLYYWKLKRVIRGVRLPLMGVLKEHRNKGIDVAFMYTIMETLRVSQYHFLDAGWILETNQLLSIVEKVGTLFYKTHRFYQATT